MIEYKTSACLGGTASASVIGVLPARQARAGGVRQKTINLFFVTETPVAFLTNGAPDLGRDYSHRTGWWVRKGKTMDNDTQFGPPEEMVTKRELDNVKIAFENRLDEYRDRVNAMNERARDNLEAHRREVNLAKRKIEHERDLVEKALQDAHAGKPDFLATSEELKPLFHKVFRIAQLLGFTGEARTIADGLGLDYSDFRFSEMYDGSDTNADREEQILRISGDTANAIHPRDPRAQAVWRECVLIAQREDMCGEYEAIAERVGIPTDFEMEFEGYIEVSFSGYASIPVSGTATRQQLQDGSIEELANINPRDYIDEVEINIDSQSVEFTS